MFGRGFGAPFHSSFDDDPFFRDHRSAMNNMMRNFGDPFGMGNHPALEAPHELRGRDQQRQRPRDDMLMPHMDMFSHMNSMFGNMHRNFETMGNDPNSFSYSSSSVMSYSNDGSGEPQYFHATSSQRQAPGGIKETKKSVRDSRAGIDKMAIGQHIGERGHEYQRSRNTRTGEEDETRNFMNMDEDEAPQFDRQWRDATRQHHNALGFRENEKPRRRQRPRHRAVRGLEEA
eukprot:Seg2385.2 transcript_id=Seg2385.2/GoldUCD/mRNA.D3Y31 product="Myeloid leukemia factor 1" protein_id=Seg2385.2/GoldUCD/D3Y31